MYVHPRVLSLDSLVWKTPKLCVLCAGQIVLPPSPRAPPGTSLFLLLPRSSYHLNFYVPRPIWSPKSPFFRVPRPFLSHAYFLWLWGFPGGGDGGRTIWPSHNHYSKITFEKFTFWPVWFRSTRVLLDKPFTWVIGFIWVFMIESLLTIHWQVFHTKHTNFRTQLLIETGY